MVLLLGLLALLPALLPVLLPGTVAAHASLVATDPADGAVLDAAPERVTLSFSEPVDLVENGYRLFDARGEVATLEAEARGADVVVSMPAGLADGSYVVSWRVVSLDSHPISGVVMFAVGEAGAAPVTVPAEADITPVVGVVQGIGYLGLLGAAGMVLFNLMTGEWGRDRRLIGLFAAVAVVAHALLIPLVTIRADGEALSAIARAEAWRGEPARQALAAALIVAFGLGIAWLGVATGGRSGAAHEAMDLRASARLIGMIVGVGLAIISLSVVGHTRTVEPTIGMVGTDLVHGTATSTWFGGLLGLGRYVWQRGRVEPGRAAVVVGRFSLVAGIALLAAASSGAYMAYQIIGSRDALLETTYGRLLIAKLLVLLIPLGLAVWNRFWLVPAVEREADDASAWRSLRGTVVGEAALLVVVIGLTGFLVLQSPQVPGVAARVYAETVALKDGSMAVTITPGATGLNQMTIEVRDGAGQPVELVDDPVVRMTLPAEELGPIETTLAATGAPGAYGGTVRVPLDGEWKIEVDLRVSRFEQSTATVTVDVPGVGD